MYEWMEINLGGVAIPTYALLMAVGFLLTLALGIVLGKRKGLRGSSVCLYGVLAAALGLLIGRGVYCAVRWDMVFVNEWGEFGSPLAFFNIWAGSINVMGVVAGLLLAAPLAALITKEKAAAYLDAAVIPGLLLYIFARAVEPFSGQGYGFFMDTEVSVSAIELVLTALVLVSVILLGKKVRRPGTLAQYALVLWCLVQILPESLRCDEALFVLVFARVTHLGLAFTIGLTLIRLLVQEGKLGLDTKSIILDLVGLAFGIGLCIATIFALDKTNLPQLLVYGVMILSLVELGVVLCHRIHQADIRKVE